MQVIKDTLTHKNLTLSLVESMTGGTITSKLVLMSGISKVLLGTLVSYQDIIKTNILKVSPSLIEQYGVVSLEVSLEMALKGMALFESSLCLSVTGFSESPHVAYISIVSEKQKVSYKLTYETLNRHDAIQFVSDKALEYLGKFLLSL